MPVGFGKTAAAELRGQAGRGVRGGQAAGVQHQRPVAELFREKGRHVFIGAFAALASYALFHVVTIFPLSWAQLFTDQSLGSFLMVQVAGGFLAIGGVLASGLIADRLGRVQTLAGTAVAIAGACVELCGPIGYAETELVEKWARDAKILDIFEGTQQIQLLVVARRLLDLTSAESA